MDIDIRECPHGHGPLALLEGEFRCQTCCWSETNSKQTSRVLATKERELNSIWDYTIAGLWWGCLVGSILKAIDTAAFLFFINEQMGYMFLFAIGSIIASNWFGFWPIIIVLFIGIRLGIQTNYFITVISSTLIGCLAVGPLGMIVGTIIGYRKRSQFHQQDTPEGAKPLIFGIIVPFLGWAAFVTFYFLWFIPKMIEWLK